jgi:hypothetical protein
MDVYTATEIAYKNGREAAIEELAGKARELIEEYRNKSKCHDTDACRNDGAVEALERLLEKISEA